MDWGFLEEALVAAQETTSSLVVMEVAEGCLSQRSGIPSLS